MVKTYVCDTNVLFQTNGDILTGLEDNNVVITHTTLEELDNHKNDPGERGYSAREALRTIFMFKDSPEGSYDKGYKTRGGGTFRIETNHITGEFLPGGWDMSKPDNKILSTVAYLTHTLKEPVILITNDAEMHVNAMLAGLSVQDYHNERILPEEYYSGRAEYEITAKAIEGIYKDKANDGIPFEKIIPKKDRDNIAINEFLNLHAGTSSVLCYVDKDMLIKRIDDIEVFSGIKGRNAGQRFMMHALLAPVEEVPLVIIKGGAGTGKTMLSLACALDQVYDQKYDNVVITRSNTLSDNDIGFLPGDLKQKMDPLVMPFYDSLRMILKHNEKEEMEQINLQIDDMVASGTIEITSLAYMRGRSIANSFIIISESQNLTISQVKTIVTRAGIGTKVIIEGDPAQVDAARLSSRSNGLVYLSSKYKNSPLAMQVEMKETECVRSPLAASAAKIL